MSRISVTIHQLVLSGFDRADGKAVAEGLERELSRVLSGPTTRAHWARSAYTPVVRLPAMSLDTGTSGRRKFGAAMGRQIGKGLK
jgi:hypothetical protein